MEANNAQAAKELAVKLQTLVVGAAVRWTEADEAIPEGTVGKVVEVLDDGGVAAVEFGGEVFGLPVGQLVPVEQLVSVPE